MCFPVSGFYISRKLIIFHAHDNLLYMHFSALKYLNFCTTAIEKMKILIMVE